MESAEKNVYLVNENLIGYCDELTGEYDAIPPSRREELIRISDYISGCRSNGKKTTILFVCTHNSRRSIYAQAWLYAASIYFDLDRIESLSGGTEASEVKDTVISTLKDAGFNVTGDNHKEGNPAYSLSAGEGIHGIILRSEIFSEVSGPGVGFAAVMVCSDADEACPIVPGAEARFPLHYDDPKSSDGTDSENERYTETCRRIAREIFFMAENIK